MTHWPQTRLQPQTVRRLSLPRFRAERDAAIHARTQRGRPLFSLHAQQENARDNERPAESDLPRQRLCQENHGQDNDDHHAEFVDGGNP